MNCALHPAVCPERCLATFSSGRQLSGTARGRLSAFTLIELMVVMILIGILSAMILPEMKGTFGDALLRSSGRDLVNVFSLAYSQSVSLNQVHIVRLDQKSGHFTVERQVRGRGARAEFVPLKDTTGSSGQLDERISVEVHKQSDFGAAPEDGASAPASMGAPGEQTPEDAITFYPDGTADGVEVLLHDRAGFGLRLRVDPVTARVEVRQLNETEPKP